MRHSYHFTLEFITYQLCDLGQVIQPLCACFLICKLAIKISILSHRAGRIN